MRVNFVLGSGILFPKLQKYFFSTSQEQDAKMNCQMRDIIFAETSDMKIVAEL